MNNYVMLEIRVIIKPGEWHADKTSEKNSEPAYIIISTASVK